MQRSHLFFSMSATKFATIFEQARSAADESAMVVASTQPLKRAQLRRGERFALSSGGQFWEGDRTYPANEVCDEQLTRLGARAAFVVGLKVSLRRT
jgi:hypothetical protein